MHVTAIVLAAGASTRFGSPKQHLVFRGETLLAHAIRIAREAGCERVLAVVRPGEKVDGAEAIENADAANGISTSIRAGVAACSTDTPVCASVSASVYSSDSLPTRLLLTLCDQPLLTADHLRALLAIDAPIVATSYAGTIGVPAVFDARFAEDLMALAGDRGARSILEAHRTEVVAVPFENAAIDIDTPDDLKRAGS